MAIYSLDPVSENCYPNTATLINKFGITDENELQLAEYAITQEAAATWERKPLCNSFDFGHYRAIHKHLFHELYDWSGQIRNVDISKKGTQFCAFEKIEIRAKQIFARLQKLNVLKCFSQKNLSVNLSIFIFRLTIYTHFAKATAERSDCF